MNIKPAQIVAGVAAGVVLAGGGYAIAASRSAVIHGCVSKKTHALSVTAKCGKGAHVLTWNRQGRAGARGARGATGAPGSAATVSIGGVATGAPGSQASVTNVGTASNAKLDFTIPAGQNGTNGTDGTDTGPDAYGQVWMGSSAAELAPNTSRNIVGVGSDGIGGGDVDVQGCSSAGLADPVINVTADKDPHDTLAGANNTANVADAYISGWSTEPDTSILVVDVDTTNPVDGQAVVGLLDNRHVLIQRCQKERTNHVCAPFLTDAPRGRGVTRRPRDAWRRRLAVHSVTIAGLLILAAFDAAPAAANEYTGMLAPGTITVGSGTSVGSAGFVYGDYQWVAPSGENFAGFAYTSGYFSSVSDSGIGGVSAGFGGDGTANQPTILFPWTQDCSITNSGHEWTANGQQAGTSHQQTCNTSGNTGGWNYDNSELENTAPGTNPQAEYHTLWLTVFCQSSTCPYDSGREWGAAGASVTNLSATIDDSYNQPSGSASWTGNNGGWYQTDTSSSPVINVSAADPGGVCAIGTWFTGPASYYLQPVNASPGMENPGSPIGTEFDSITPCPGAGGGTVSGSVALPGGLASGTYNLSVVASNPGTWEAGAGLSNAPTIASYGNTINIDDTVPAISWANTSGAWTSATSEQFTVTAGPSGISGVACTDNGTAVAATLVNGNTYSVATDDQGANAISCTAGNGDANGALTSPASTMTYNVDTTVPTLTFSDSGYTPATWTNAAQTVTVAAAGGPSGISTLKCYVDGVSAPLGGSASNQVTVSGDGQHVLDCTATSNTNVTGEATYNVWVDTREPNVSFSGAQPAPAWLSGTPTVVVIGAEAGGTLSGITQLVCTVDGGSPITLNVDAAQGFTGSFVLTANGADVVSCQATDAAGTTGPATSETVNVDNPSVLPASASLTRYGSSPLIDGGDDPFSNGPSQTTWHRDPQSVTITANNTGGGASIESISCTGAELGAGTTGTWPIDDFNTDSQGGEQITVTVQPPGGDLACTATDTAGNTYALGSYEFELDDQAPTGYFEPEASWPKPDEVQVYVTDGAQGSGTATVEVTAQENGGTVHKVMATRDPSRPDVWDAQFNDGAMPAGAYTFVAYPTDVAGNSGQVTTNQAGGTETLELPLRDMTALSDTLTAGSATASGAQQQTVSEAAATAAAPIAKLRGQIDAVIARASAKPCRRAKAVAHRERKARPCSATKPLAKRKIAFVTVAYGQAAKLSGTLTSVKAHKPIAGARIVIEQQVLGRKTVTKLGSARTNRKGAYTFHVKAGASRTLLAVYDGTPLLRGAQVNVGEHVKGKASLHVSGTLTPGHELLVNGKLDGGFVPAGGALVTIQYAVKGFRGWTNWGDTHTTARGAFKVRMPILAADAHHTFQWRAVIKAQTGWAFLAGQSNTITRAIA